MITLHNWTPDLLNNWDPILLMSGEFVITNGSDIRRESLLAKSPPIDRLKSTILNRNSGPIAAIRMISHYCSQHDSIESHSLELIPRNDLTFKAWLSNLGLKVFHQSGYHAMNVAHLALLKSIGMNDKPSTYAINGNHECDKSSIIKILERLSMTEEGITPRTLDIAKRIVTLSIPVFLTLDKVSQSAHLRGLTFEAERPGTGSMAASAGGAVSLPSSKGPTL